MLKTAKKLNPHEYTQAHYNRFNVYYKLKPDKVEDILFIFFDAFEDDKDWFCNRLKETREFNLFPKLDEDYGTIKIKMDRICACVLNSYNFELIAKLSNMKIRDQKFRGRKSFLSKEQHKLDSLNQIEMIEIFESYGYPDRRIVGVNYEEHLFYILLHSNVELIEKYRHLVLKSIDENRLHKSFYPFMIDRLKLLKGEPQVFGTQQITNDKGELELYRIENAELMNDKRKAYGLEPLLINN